MDIQSLKVELFDIIREQAELQTKFNELEKQKASKLNELKSAESDNSKQNI